MRSIVTTTTILFSAFLTQPVFAAEAVGVSEIAIPSPERGKNLAVTVWYPSDGSGVKTLSGDDRIFQGTPVELLIAGAAGDGKTASPPTENAIRELSPENAPANP